MLFYYFTFLFSLTGRKEGHRAFEKIPDIYVALNVKIDLIKIIGQFDHI